jgi:hypothetical protein
VERNIQSFTSFSKDGRYMHIDSQRATQDGLYMLLNCLRSSNSVFEIRYYCDEYIFSIDSVDLSSENPDEDKEFIEKKVDEMLAASYIEIEKTVEMPQVMYPDIEYNI